MLIVWQTFSCACCSCAKRRNRWKTRLTRKSYTCNHTLTLHVQKLPAACFCWRGGMKGLGCIGTQLLRRHNTCDSPTYAHVHTH